QARTVGPDRTLTTGEPELEPLSKSGQIFGLGYRSDADAAKLSTAHMVAQSKATMFRVTIGCPNKTYDEIFEHAAQEEITILPDIVFIASEIKEKPSGSHEYSCTSNTETNKIPPPSEHGEWKAELEAIVKRYGHGGTFWAEHSFPHQAELIPDHWEIWNEENTERYGSTEGRIRPAWYGALLPEAHEAITNVNPNAQVLIGGLLTVSKHRPSAKEVEENPELEDEIAPQTFLKQAGHFEDYDDVSLHPYAFRGVGEVPHAPHNTKDVERITERVFSSIVEVRGKLHQLGEETEKMPIWITEIGWPINSRGARNDGTHWLVSESIQRDLLTSTFRMMKGETKAFNVRKLHIAAIMYYNIADSIEGVPAEKINNWEYHCGLLEDSPNLEESKKRSAWFAFQAQAE
ncbi:MAG TPA: hypothetical protein VGC32_20045, partial [Solirubrobacterales bacterium]